MTYKTKITSKSTETPRIDTLLYEIEKGNYFIPDFQRFFVWTPERVKSLIDSLLKDVNNLFNIALLDFESNRDITVKAPSEYIKLENEEFQNGYDLSLSVKESHFLDEIDEDILIIRWFF